MQSDEKIYQKILKAIVEHKVEPGMRLPEDQLSEAFGVSRTGIRRVLQRLALEHFVCIQPNKGANVKNPTKKEAEEVFLSRILLEPQMIPDILKNWNEEHSDYFKSIIEQENEAHKEGNLSSSIQLTARFHYELAQVTKNLVLAEFIEQLCYRSSLIIAAYGSKKSVNCDCGDHSELIELLDSHSLDKAQHWMQHHLERIKSSVQLDIPAKQSINFQQLFADMD